MRRLRAVHGKRVAEGHLFVTSVNASPDVAEGFYFRAELRAENAQKRLFAGGFGFGGRWCRRISFQFVSLVTLRVQAPAKLLVEAIEQTEFNR